MAEPRVEIQKAPATVPSIAAPSFEDEVVEYLLDLLPKHIKSHDGTIDQEELADDILKFARSRGPTTLDFFHTVQKRFTEKIASRTEASLYLAIVEPLFGEIEEKLSLDRHAFRLSPVLGMHEPVANGSYINTSQVDLWHHLSERSYVNGGFYRSGDPDIAGTFYASLKHNFHFSQSKYFESSVTGAFGAFSIHPESKPRQRYVFAGMPSLAAFLGAELPLYDGLTLRSGVETKAMMPIGWHMGPNYPMNPSSAGVSLGNEVSEDTSYAFGVKSSFEFFPAGEGARKWLPHYDHASVFSSWRSDIVDGALSIGLPRNETTGSIAISKTFPWMYGLWTVSAAGSSTLDHKWISSPPGFFLGLVYSQTSDDRQRGVTVRANAQITAGRNELGYERSAPPHEMTKLSAEFFNAPYGGKDASCRLLSTHEGLYSYECYPHGNDQDLEPLHCSGRDQNALTCEVPLDYGNTMVYSATASGSDGVYPQYAIGNNPALSSKNQTLSALAGSGDMETFISTLNDASYQQKLMGLTMLSQLAYLTYNHDGLSSLSGHKKIPPEQMFREMRTALLDPRHTSATMVCDGIAQFIAYLGHRLGLEAHAVLITTKTEPHAITMLRAPGESYAIIGGGTSGGLSQTHANTAIEALLAYSSAANLPPQLRFIIADHEGNYERTLLTNEGKLLTESITPPDRLPNFLEFRKR